MKVIAFVGRSGSGKTTAIETLIRHYVSHGRSVGAIKHTHHELNTDDRGDTGRFRRAGAQPVILAGSRRAVVFSDARPEIIHYDAPRDLVQRLITDIVLIEGFASAEGWPRIDLVAGEWLGAADLIARADAVEK